MSTKHAALAAQVLKLVGGADNVRSLHHCQTRLRFDLKDPAKADVPALEQADGVATTIASGTGLQIVVGLAVKEIHDEVQSLLTKSGVKLGESEAEHKQKLGPVGAFIDFMAGVFVPVIPAFAGAGMVRAVLSLMVTFGWTDRTAQAYQILNFFAGAVFYFLPILLAFSAGTKLKTNPYLAAVTAAIMLHPTWVGLVQAGEPVNLFGVPLFLADYGSSVVPILLVVWVQAYLERFLNKVVPAAIKVIVVPLVTIMVMGSLALAVLGPIGDVVGGFLGDTFTYMATTASWAPPLFLGALWAPMVVLGVHHSIGPLGLAQIASVGYDNLVGPGIILANVSQGVAGLVVAWRTKDRKFRQIASAGGITALMGVTEPVLYGVNVPKRYPLIAGCIGAATGGVYAGITAVRRFAAGVSGLPALPMYIGEDGLVHLLNITIALAIAISVTAVLTFFLALKFEKRSVVESEAEDAADVDIAPVLATAGAAASTMAAGAAVGVLERTTTDITSPAVGTVIPLSQVQDAAFASGAMGPGVGINPTSGTIVAPVSGTVVAAMKTGHAFGIRTDDGIEVLVHIGVDTVQMDGKGFVGAVTQGSRVEAGQTLVTADLDAIAKAGHPSTVILVITNARKTGSVEVIGSDAVIAGEPVLSIGS